MKSSHRKILSELCSLCGEMGNALDYTATSYEKLKNRQRQLANVYKVLYGVLCDHPENDQKEDDMQRALESLERIRKASKIIFPDRNGSFNSQEMNHPNKYNQYEHD